MSGSACWSPRYSARRSGQRLRPMTKACPRCRGKMIREDDGRACLNCGYVRYDGQLTEEEARKEVRPRRYYNQGPRRRGRRL